MKMGDNRLDPSADTKVKLEIVANSTRGIAGKSLFMSVNDSLNSSTIAAAAAGEDPSNPSDDPLSNNILYIIIAVAVIVFVLSLVFILTKILRCHCLACISGNRYSSSPNGLTLSGSKRGKHQRESKLAGPAGLLEEDPIRGLIVPDIKIIDEDGNIIPRASFS